MKFSLEENKHDDENNVEWVSWYKDLKEEGDSFEITVSKVNFKEEPKPVFYLIDEEGGIGTSVFCVNHEDSKFESTPHGIRFVNALGRKYGLIGDLDVEEVLEPINDSGATVKVEKTAKGILWTIL